MKYSWGGVWNPELKRVEVFQMRSLPFGATASVAAFLRVSRALRTLGTRMGRLVWTSFFDDFIALSRQEDAQSADLLDLIQKDAGFHRGLQCIGCVCRLAACAERRDSYWKH